ncbi:hypothetical protein P8C59_004324 [Phyllachora maydis]|uniref:Small EDRK-rich factor-like N-terminal domain-containing protein n=1 Tax=Phyllachora maydis TaxID=1825666 RepID=A0AAD9I213_9PEZI|nr:hypothetical protein P8C59_004324 [Phyllachora maydis]
MLLLYHLFNFTTGCRKTPSVRPTAVAMARGNQRDKAREANQKKQAGQKKGNNLSGTEMQRAKEEAAAKMRAKQAAADARKAEAAAAGKK